MMHITVEDALAWRRHAAQIIDTGEYKGARVKGPQMEPYGVLVTYVWDPSGVLLHFAQFLVQD
jgi:ribosomal protein S10